MRKLMFALAAQAVAVGAVSAQSRPLVAPIVPCPPVVVVPNCPPGTTFVTPGTVPGTTPVTPGTPPGTPEVPGTPPQVPPPVVSAPDVDGGGFARQSEGGTQVAQSFAPNMFGDILGSRSIKVTYRTPFRATFNVAPGTVTTATGIGRTIDPSGGTAQFGGGNSGIRDSGPIGIPTGRDLSYVQPSSPDGGVADTTYARNALQTLLSSGQLTEAQIASLNQLTPAQRQQLLNNRGQINRTITQATRGLAVRTLTVSPVDATVMPAGGGTVTYTGELLGEQNVPLPGGSTYVGRLKISEDTSPLPRDRVIFAYDHFNSVPFTSERFDVNRFQFGIEKTFLDGRWSVEARLPFAGTIAATHVQGFEVSGVELGNLRLSLKRILTQNNALTTTSGISVTLPTAADQVVLSSLDLTELYRFKNEQVTVEPFIAALFTPNSRLFAQTWASVNFDVSGGQLTYNTAVFGGSGSTRFLDVPFLSVDQQIGYWIIQRDTGTLRGLAPFVELHWNYAIAQREILQQVNDQLPANGLSTSGVANHELNLVAGFLMQIGDNLNVGVGASAPLLQKPDRTFDAQVGVRANYLFGRTARARNPIYNINSY